MYGCKREVGDLEHFQRRRDVEHGQRAHARAAVVADQMESLVAEPGHQLDQIERHGALRIVGMVRPDKNAPRAVSFSTDVATGACWMDAWQVVNARRSI